MAVFWATALCHLVVEEARFRMRVTLGVVLIRSLVFITYVPGRILSGSRVALNQWVPGEVIKTCYFT